MFIGRIVHCAHITKLNSCSVLSQTIDHFTLADFLKTKLPSEQELRWLRTWKPLAYRESTCTNLSVSCPYEIIVYSVLKHNFLLTLLECTQSADNLLHPFTVLWEKEYFLKSNLFCPFTSVKSCPLVILHVLI